MIIGGRIFKPALWSIVLTVVGVVLFVALGLWQLERAAYKKSIKLKFEQRLSEEYQPFKSGDELDDIEYRRLFLRGNYDNAHNFLLDNQLYRGKAGYHVLTPLQLVDTDYVILVDRGWVEWGASREHLPEIRHPRDAAKVAGIASVPDNSGFQLGQVKLSGNWPQVIPYLDMKALQQQFSDRLLPVVLWMAPEHPGHYIRVWNPVYMSPEKSEAYAVQWFSFTAIAVILFIVLNLRKVK